MVPESQLYVVEIDGRVAEGFEQAPVNFQLPFKRVVLRLRPEPEETAQTMRSEATNPLFTERQTAAVRLLQLLHEGIKSLQGSTLLSGFAFGTQALLDAGAPRSRRSEPARDQVLMGHAGAVVQDFDDGARKRLVISPGAGIGCETGYALDRDFAGDRPRVIRILHEFEDADLLRADELFAEYRNEARVGNKLHLLVGRRGTSIRLARAGHPALRPKTRGRRERSVREAPARGPVSP